MITAQSSCPQTRKVAKTILAVSVIAAAALVFAKSTWAAVGNNQICNPASTCTIGEFVYDDEYNPLNSAVCTITARYPDGTVYLNAQSLTYAAQDDGWYSYSFTAPATTGLYRATISCTVNAEVMRIDKSFEVKSDASSAPTANEVAEATWGYSDRTLTSFGTLVSDIWDAATRTLTGASLNSGSIATKADVNEVADDIASVSTRIDTINSTVSSVTESVESINQSNSTVIEAYLNQPIIQHVLENGGGSGSSLQLKIDNSKSSALLIATNATYISRKAALVYQKWNTYDSKELAKMIRNISDVTSGKSSIHRSITSSANSMYKSWEIEPAKKILTTAQVMNITLQGVLSDLEKNKKTNSSKNKIAVVFAQASKIESYVGDKKNPKEDTVYGSIQEVENLAKTYDTLDAKLYAVLKSWGSENAVLQKKENLEKDVIAVNKLPKIGSVLQPAKVSDDPTTSLKNEILSLVGVVRANKEYLARDVASAFASTSLEIGSVVFKSIITNPSNAITQTVPLRYELPQEIQKEHILSIDEGLEVSFDAAKNVYVVTGSFDLKPNESKTLSVEADDKVFEISKSEIESLRNQAKELAEPLKGTSFFAQGVTLVSDINASLDRALSFSESATPEEKIKNFREAEIEIKSANEKIEKLKELVTEAGSVGTFFGFVGGAQTLAVWGMIIILVAGFVFMTLYMRTLRSYDLKMRSSDTKGARIANVFDKRKKKGKKEEAEEVPEKQHKRFRPSFKVGVLVMGSLAILTGVGAGFMTEQYANKLESKKVTKTLGVQKAAETYESLQKSKKVTLFVPDGVTISIHEAPSITSKETFNISETTPAEVTAEHEGFSKVYISDKKTTISGWVDSDFIEEKESEPTYEKESKSVMVSDEVEAYLKIRSEPATGEIIGKAYSGDFFPFVSEKDGWVEVELSGGDTGYISSEYVLVQD